VGGSRLADITSSTAFVVPSSIISSRAEKRCEALQQRQDLAIVWLHLDGDHRIEARHCVACQPRGPVIDVSCSCCGNGPLITGQRPEFGGQLAVPTLDWLHSRGWQLRPRPPCPAGQR